jgi:hypothetical protein
MRAGEQARRLAEQARQRERAQRDAQERQARAERERRAAEQQRQVRERLAREQAQREQHARDLQAQQREQRARDLQVQQRNQQRMREQERVRLQLQKAVEQQNKRCVAYKRPPQTAAPAPRLYKAAEVIQMVTPEDWQASINEARFEHARAGGKTNRPLTLDEVKAILTKAGTFGVYEDVGLWKSKMGLLRTLGERVNDMGIGADCTVMAGHADTERKAILINPYLKSPSVKRGTQLHELEHIVKELAGVPSGAMTATLPGRPVSDTVHHVTSYADKQKTILKWEPPRKHWWQR